MTAGIMSIKAGQVALSTVPETPTMTRGVSALRRSYGYDGYSVPGNVQHYTNKRLSMVNLSTSRSLLFIVS